MSSNNTITSYLNIKKFCTTINNWIIIKYILMYLQKKICIIIKELDIYILLCSKYILDYIKLTQFLY